MMPITKEIVNMIDMLPEQEQNLAFEFIKRMVLAWDPDYTKVTIEELKAINTAEKEIDNAKIISHDDIDWN